MWRLHQSAGAFAEPMAASFFLKAIFNKNEYDKTASRSTGDGSFA
jgi:hypothetical protein